MHKTVPFEDCPVGMFLSPGGYLCVKTEYGLDAYVVATGEKFWGGAKTLAQLRRVMVTPVEDVEPVVRCKYCIMHREITKDTICCMMTGKIVLPNFFCSLGKEGE